MLVAKLIEPPTLLPLTTRLPNVTASVVVPLLCDTATFTVPEMTIPFCNAQPGAAPNDTVTDARDTCTLPHRARFCDAYAPIDCAFAAGVAAASTVGSKLKTLSVPTRACCSVVFASPPADAPRLSSDDGVSPLVELALKRAPPS